MKMADEKILTVPLRKGFLKAVKYDRTRKAKDVLKLFLKKHLKKDVKIGKYLNLELWKNGRQNPPGKVKVRIEESEDKVVAELIDAPREKPKVEEKNLSEKASPKKEETPKKEEKTEAKEVAKDMKKEEKEKTKKAIEKAPIKEEKKVDSFKKEAKAVEREHAHRKEEKVIPQKND